MGRGPVASPSLKKKRFLPSLHSYIAIELYSCITIEDLARIKCMIAWPKNYRSRYKEKNTKLLTETRSRAILLIVKDTVFFAI